MTSSYSYGQMVAARIVTGVGVGFSTVAVPILQTETLVCPKWSGFTFGMLLS
jgi:hypothetical protein